MATKRIFSIDGSSISTMIKGLFTNINNSRFIATSKNGNNILNLPLLVTIILVIVFPFLLVAGIILSILLKIKVSVERDITEEVKLIDQKQLS